MTFLPIVDRELRVASRRLSTYATRAVSALAAMGLCVWALVVMSRFASMQQSGAELFRTLSWLAFFYGLIDLLLHLPFPPGVLLEWLG